MGTDTSGLCPQIYTNLDPAVRIFRFLGGRPLRVLCAQYRQTGDELEMTKILGRDSVTQLDGASTDDQVGK
jgi:hypothetical protein